MKVQKMISLVVEGEVQSGFSTLSTTSRYILLPYTKGKLDHLRH
jgi:hypothetical protein